MARAGVSIFAGAYNGLLLLSLKSLGDFALTAGEGKKRRRAPHSR
jgi:hypothetical protein